MPGIEWSPVSGMCVEIGIQIADPEESLRFYRDTLGLEVFGQTSVPARQIWALRAADCIVKLVHDTQPVTRSNPRIGLRSDERALGFFALAFNVKNGEEIMKACEAAGFEVVIPWEPVPSTYGDHARRDVGGHGSVRDPDGNRVTFHDGDPWVRSG